MNERDALIQELMLGAPGTGTSPTDFHAHADRIIAIMRPISSIVLTREEASACAWALNHLITKHNYDALRSRDGSRVGLLALAERLEAAS